MAIRDYTCFNCEITEEHIMRSNDPTPVCEKCKTEMVRDLNMPTGVGISLKGSCWAKDGYRSKTQ